MADTGEHLRNAERRRVNTPSLRVRLPRPANDNQAPVRQRLKRAAVVVTLVVAVAMAAMQVMG